MVVPIPKIGYNKKKPVKNDQVMALLYNCRFYYRKEAQKCPIFYFGHVGGSKMAVLIPKTGYNKKPVKSDQVMALLYNCHFYYRKEAHKYPVFYYGRVGGSRMAFPIPKTGYNKNFSNK